MAVSGGLVTGGRVYAGREVGRMLPDPRKEHTMPLAIAGTGLGIIGILVVILLVLLIVYFLRRA